MKKTIFIIALFLSNALNAQVFQAFDNCFSIQIRDTVTGYQAAYAKSQLQIFYSVGNSLQLQRMNPNPTIIASWNPATIGVLALSLDSGYNLLSSWMINSCWSGATGATGPTGAQGPTGATGAQGPTGAGDMLWDTTTLANGVFFSNIALLDSIYIVYISGRGGISPIDSFTPGVIIYGDSGISLKSNSSIYQGISFDDNSGKYEFTNVPQNSLSYTYGEDSAGRLSKSLPPLDLLRDTTVIITDTTAIQNCFTTPITVLDIPYMNVWRVSAKVENSAPDTVAYDFADPCNISQAGDTLSNFSLNEFCCDSVMYGTSNLIGRIQAWSASRPLTLWNEKSNATRGRGIIRLKIYYTLENF